MKFQILVAVGGFSFVEGLKAFLPGTPNEIKKAVAFAPKLHPMGNPELPDEDVQELNSFKLDSFKLNSSGSEDDQELFTILPAGWTQTLN